LWGIDEWLRHRERRKYLRENLSKLYDSDEEVRHDALEWVFDYLKNNEEDNLTYDDKYFMETERGDKTTEKAEIVFEYGGLDALLNLISKENINKQSDEILKTMCSC